MLFPVILYRNKSHLPIPWCVKNNVFRSVFISDTSEQYAKLRTWFDRLSSEAAFQDATKTLFPKVESLLKVTFTLVCTGWGSQMEVKIYGLYLYQIFMSKYLHSFIPFSRLVFSRYMFKRLALHHHPMFTHPISTKRRMHQQDRHQRRRLAQR